MWLACYAAPVFLAPALLGANRGWSVALIAMMLALATLAAIAAWPRWFRMARPAPLSRIAPLILAAIAVFGLAATGYFWSAPQLIPELIALLNNGHPPPADRIRLTESLLGYTAACLSFMLAFVYTSAHPQDARRVLLTLAVVIAAYSLFGIFRACAVTNQTEALTHGLCTIVSAPFINHNNFATYVNFGLIICTVFLFDHLSRMFRHDQIRFDRRGLAFVIESLFGRVGFLLAGTALFGTTLLLAQSRAGTFSAIAALGVAFAILLIANRRQWLRLIAPMGAALAALALVWLASSGGVVARLGERGFWDEQRWQIYQATWRMIVDRPLTGHGFGNFQETMQQYRNWEMGPYPDWDKAHNSYLELMAGLGIPGALLFFALFALMALYCAGGLRKKRVNALYPAIGLATLALVALHALVDFSMQIPAVEVTFAFVLGVCVAKSLNTAPPTTG